MKSIVLRDRCSPPCGFTAVDTTAQVRHRAIDGRKPSFAAYEARKAAQVTHPVYRHRMSYSRMLEVQARTLAAYLRGSVST